MSLPIFSQTDTNNQLVCLPINQAQQIAVDLTDYDKCLQEKTFLEAEIKDLRSIITQDSLVLNQYKITTDSLFLLNEQYLSDKATLSLDIKNKNDKIQSLRSTRNLTLLTTIIGTLTPILLSK